MTRAELANEIRKIFVKYTFEDHCYTEFMRTSDNDFINFAYEIESLIFNNDIVLEGVDNEG